MRSNGRSHRYRNRGALSGCLLVDLAGETLNESGTPCCWRKLEQQLSFVRRSVPGFSGLFCAFFSMLAVLSSRCFAAILRGCTDCLEPHVLREALVSCLISSPG